MNKTFVGRHALWLSIIGLLVIMPFLGQAAEIRTGEQPSVAGNERITEDIYIAGGNVSSAGVVAGDLITVGGNILVSGGVGGDLMMAGGSLTILGNVADDVRVAGGNITLQGGVGGDAAVAGGQLSIGGSGIKGDLLAGGGTVRVDTSVGGDIRIGGGDIYLNGLVVGNVEVFAEKLTLGKSAKISGNLTYTSKKEATFEEGATVAGETTFKQVEKKVSSAGVAAILFFAVFSTFLMHLVPALFLGLFFRRYSSTIIESVVAQPFMEIGRGLVVFIVLPVVSVMLLVTFLGIPLGILGLLAFAILMVALWMVVPIVLGPIAYKVLFKGEYEVNWKTILFGVFLYTVLGFIPFIGWFAQFVLMLAALGANIKLKWEVAKEWR